MCSPQLWGRQLCFNTLKGKSLHKLALIPHLGDFSMLIYLFNQSFISIWPHGYLFYTLGYTLMLLFILLLRLLQDYLFICGVGGWFLCLLCRPIILFLELWAHFAYSLTQLSTISPRNPDSLYQRMVLGINIWKLAWCACCF